MSVTQQENKTARSWLPGPRVAEERLGRTLESYVQKTYYATR